MVRMRYAHQIVQEIQKIDPQTSITTTLIKHLAAADNVRTIRNGRCMLICLDDILALLEKTSE